MAYVFATHSNGEDRGAERMKRVVMFSGGICSWAAARRVKHRMQWSDQLTLLFTDTKAEDEDLYRFLSEAAEDIGGELVWIAEGRTPWQVFRDNKMIGNTRADICSRILKRDLSDKWLADNCDPASTTIYLGISWDEAHRFDGVDENGSPTGAKHRYARLGWRCEAPMIEPPYRTRNDILASLRRSKIVPPRMYAEGWAHNNCNRFCIKAGEGHFSHLLRVRPDLYQFHEEQEADPVFNGHTILRDRRGGETKPLSLRQLRERIEAGGQVDMFDLGGCGCFTSETADV